MLLGDINVNVQKDLDGAEKVIYTGSLTHPEILKDGSLLLLSIFIPP